METAMRLAARAGAPKALSKLVRGHSKWSIQQLLVDPEGSILSEALKRGNHAVLKELFGMMTEYKAFPSIDYRTFESKIHLAIKYKNEYAFQQLMHSYQERQLLERNLVWPRFFFKIHKSLLYFLSLALELKNQAAAFWLISEIPKWTREEIVRVFGLAAQSDMPRVLARLVTLVLTRSDVDAHWLFIEGLRKSVSHGSIECVKLFLFFPGLAAKVGPLQAADYVSLLTHNFNRDVFTTIFYKAAKQLSDAEIESLALRILRSDHAPKLAALMEAGPLFSKGLRERIALHTLELKNVDSYRIVLSRDRLRRFEAKTLRALYGSLILLKREDILFTLLSDELLLVSLDYARFGTDLVFSIEHGMNTIALTFMRSHLQTISPSMLNVAFMAACKNLDSGPSLLHMLQTRSIMNMLTIQSFRSGFLSLVSLRNNRALQVFLSKSQAMRAIPTELLESCFKVLVTDENHDTYLVFTRNSVAIDRILSFVHSRDIGSEEVRRDSWMPSYLKASLAKPIPTPRGMFDYFNIMEILKNFQRGAWDMLQHA